jgi:spermidine/putrescine-binding protein
MRKINLYNATLNSNALKGHLRILIALMVIACLGFAVGCRKKGPEPSTEKTGAATELPQVQENVLRLLAWEGYEPREYVEKFEDYIEGKYGKKVKMDISVSETADDFYNAIRDKSADLVTISHHTVKDKRYGFIKKKLILPFDLENIPNYSNLIPKLQKADYDSSEGKVFGIPVSNGPFGLAYNTGKVAEEPDSWGIFWEPEFKGKYVLSRHDYIYSVNVTALTLGYPKESISSYDVLNYKDFKDKLRELAVNANSFWSGTEKAEDIYGHSLAMIWGDSFSELKRMGETWKMANPKEGTIWWIDEYAMTWGLTDKPFLKKVAEEWINFSLSFDFQVNHLVRELRAYPVITNISDKLTEAENERIGNNNSPEKLSQKRILQDSFSERDRNGLKALWNEAMKGISAE